MKTSDFEYDLPPDLIAQTPMEPRDGSRLFVLDRQSDRLVHTHFKKIGDFLKTGDVLVLNKTRVIPARLFAQKLPGGGRVELLLLNRRDEVTWETLVGGKGLTAGRQIQVENAVHGEISAVLDGPRRLVRFDEPIEQHLGKAGHVPLPPYIRQKLDDPERYQTVYAQNLGSAAAPTAGLHFTHQLLESLMEQGIQIATITLHVGLDTFAPVNEDKPDEHHIHTEWCQITEDAALLINQARKKGGRIIAVGTTSVRTLESAAKSAQGDQVIAPFEGQTGLYILPGYQFKAVDAMITNFHLPRSTLLMLVSAFAGRKRILSAYEEAMKAGYRFYSFGDAMLIC